MRTRTRTIPVVIDAGTRRELSTDIATNTVVFDQTVSNAPYAATDLDGVETITDEQCKMKRYGNCLHSVTRTILTNGEFTEFWNSPGRVNSRQYTGGYWLYLRFRTLVNDWLIPTGLVKQNFTEADWANCSYEALKSMRPSFNDSFSIANDLIELHQVRELVRPFGRAFTSRSRIIRPSLLNRASNFILAYDYGLAPLISSAQSVLKLLNTIPDKIRKIREQRGRIQTRHHSQYLPLFSNTPGETTVFSDSESEPGFKAYRRFEFTKRPVYHASMRFNYDVESLSDFELTMRAALEGSGLSNPASIAWNAIPYSFIVDWFLNVDEWITSVFAEPVIPIIVRDFCHSIEYAYKTSVDGEEQSSPKIRTLAAHRDVRYYERRRALPNTIAPLTLSWPSLGNLLDGVALVGSRDGGNPFKGFRKTPRLPWLNFGKVRRNQIR